MDNLTYYNQFRSVPKEAQKTIQGGKLKGFTDINPMWRIKSLTEAFGPVGFGWYTDQVEKWVEEGNEDKVVFVKLNLYVKMGGEWSKPIVGIGGSKLESYVNGKNGQTGYYDLSDEAYKMAYTDALSIACKALGMAADIYYSKDAKSTDNRTKYDNPFEPAPVVQRQRRPAADPASYGIPVQPAYQPMEEGRYWDCIAAAAEGQVSKTGRPIKEVWASMTHAGPQECQKFDYDLANYKYENNIQ